MARRGVTLKRSLATRDTEDNLTAKSSWISRRECETAQLGRRSAKLAGKRDVDPLLLGITKPSTPVGAGGKRSHPQRSPLRSPSPREIGKISKIVVPPHT